MPSSGLNGRSRPPRTHRFDLLATVAERFVIPEYTVKQFWHERFHHDLGNRWLRNAIRELLGDPAADDANGDR